MRPDVRTPILPIVAVALLPAVSCGARQEDVATCAADASTGEGSTTSEGGPVDDGNVSDTSDGASHDAKFSRAHPWLIRVR